MYSWYSEDVIWALIYSFIFCLYSYIPWIHSGISVESCQGQAIIFMCLLKNYCMCPSQTKIQVVDHNLVFVKFLGGKLVTFPKRSRQISCTLCPETSHTVTPLLGNPPPPVTWWSKTIVISFSPWSEPQGFSCYPRGGCCLAFTAMSSSLSSPLHPGSNWKGIHTLHWATISNSKLIQLWLIQWTCAGVDPYHRVT